MVLAAVTSAAGAALAVRLMDLAWRKATHEPPPEVPKWARMLVGRPVQKQVVHRLGPPSI